MVRSGGEESKLNSDPLRPGQLTECEAVVVVVRLVVVVVDG